MKITKHAQSCFLIELNKRKILIDPGDFVFDAEGMKTEDFTDVDMIVITHEHQDHFSFNNVVEIIKKAKPKVYSSHAVIAELNKDLSNYDLNVLVQKLEHPFADISIRGVRSKHSPLPNAHKPPHIEGFILRDSKTHSTFYHPGDSQSLNIISKVSAVPICGDVTMNIDQAKEEILKTQPEIVIPIHYDSPEYPDCVADFVRTMSGTGIPIKVLNWGESFETQEKT